MGHPNMYQAAVQPQAPQNDVWTADDWNRWGNRWSQAEWEQWKLEQEQKESRKQRQELKIGCVQNISDLGKVNMLP